MVGFQRCRSESYLEVVATLEDFEVDWRSLAGLESVLMARLPIATSISSLSLCSEMGESLVAWLCDDDPNGSKIQWPAFIHG